MHTSPRNPAADIPRLLYERMADGVLIIADGKIVDCNRASVNMLGFSKKKELLTRSLADFSPPVQADGQSSAEKEQTLRTAALNEGSQRCEWLFRRTDGEIFSVEILLTALTQGYLGILWRDISKRKQTEMALQVAQQTLEARVEERTRQIERQQRVAEGLRDILSVVNSNRTMQEILDFIVLQTTHVLGNDASVVYLVQHDVLGVQAALGLDADLLSDAAIMQGEGPTHHAVSEKRLIVVSNTLRWRGKSTKNSAFPGRLADHYQALLAVPLVVKDQVYGAITLYYRDSRTFSDEEIALANAFGNQAALAIENAYLRMKAEETAAAAERDRIARDLHDSVTQTLFSATLIAQVLPHLWEHDRNEGRKQLEELRLLTRGALAEMRTLLLELRPATFAKVALPESLRHLVEAATGRSGIPITLELIGETPVRPEVKVALYRIAQEALNNIVNHAEASAARLTLVRQPGLAELHVRDDGVGFVRESVPYSHLGLSVMTERAQSIGAVLTVTTIPEQGTCISVIWRETAKGSKS